MKPIPEQEKQELNKHCKRVMNESSPDGLEYPMAEIALDSLTAEAVAYTSESALADVFTGDTGMMGKWSEIGKIPLYTAPPVPVIKLPEDGFTGGRWCPEDREGYANGVSDCIEEMERLYNIK